MGVGGPVVYISVDYKEGEGTMPTAYRRKSATQAGTTTVRVSARSHAALHEIAQKTGQTLTGTIAELVERERRRLMLAEFNASFRRLKADPEAWAAYRAEQRDWDGTVGDGLDEEEDWSDVELVASVEG